MDKIRVQSKIKRMIETWQMWQIMRFLKKNHFSWIQWDTRDKKLAETLDPTVPDHVHDLLCIMMQNRSPRGHRAHLAVNFAADKIQRKYGLTHENTIMDVNQDSEIGKELRAFVADAQVRIENCIENRYINRDEKYEDLIYLPLRGKKFAEPIGLIKEWVVEDIGILWSTAGSALIPILGYISWDWLKLASSFVSPWW